MVGGGYIGMEVSSGLNQNGLDVTMVFPEPWMMPRLFTEEIASFYEDFLAGKGITLVKGNTAKAFKGENGRVSPASCASCFLLLQALPASKITVLVKGNR